MARDISWRIQRGSSYQRRQRMASVARGISAGVSAAAASAASCGGGTAAAAAGASHINMWQHDWHGGNIKQRGVNSAMAWRTSWRSIGGMTSAAACGVARQQAGLGSIIAWRNRHVCGGVNTSNHHGMAAAACDSAGVMAAGVSAA